MQKSQQHTDTKAGALTKRCEQLRPNIVAQLFVAALLVESERGLANLLAHDLIQLGLSESRQAAAGLGVGNVLLEKVLNLRVVVQDFLYSAVAGVYCLGAA